MKEMKMQRAMLVLAVALAAAPFAPITGQASEEDYAMVSEIEITALTTCTNFGVVKLIAKQSENRARRDSVQVSFKGKTCTVSAAELEKMGFVDLATIRITSDVGYPQRGIGPYLYCTIQTADGKTKHRLVFSSGGFKERSK
jgi:hypothetical protein